MTVILVENVLQTEKVLIAVPDALKSFLLKEYLKFLAPIYALLVCLIVYIPTIHHGYNWSHRVQYAVGKELLLIAIFPALFCGNFLVEMELLS